MVVKRRNDGGMRLTANNRWGSTVFARMLPVSFLLFFLPQWYISMNVACHAEKGQIHSHWLDTPLLFSLNEKKGPWASAPCDNFFSILATAWVPADAESNCSQVYNKYRELIEVHDASMSRMNKTLTLFTTWSDEELKQGCGDLANFGINAKNVLAKQFEPESLLLKHGFRPEHITWMKSWYETAKFRHAVTRLSDVFRVLLQREIGMAYADLDIVYLLDNPQLYLGVPNVALPIWNEEYGAFEIQNSAFCFSPKHLEFLVQKIKAKLDEKGTVQMKRNVYKYTEMGPNLFQHSIQSLLSIGPVQLYYTHSDDHWRVEDVAKQSMEYGGYVWLHLDGSNRRRNWYQNKSRTYPMLVDELKSKIRIADVAEVLPSD